MSSTKELTPTTPTDRAWVTGRRIYVRSRYGSRLAEQVRDLGATWDRDERCLWVGTGKRDQVVALLAEQAERVEAVVARKAAAHWVTIPFEAEDIRARAKKLGALWDRDRKQWGLPTEDAADEIAAAVETRRAEGAPRRRVAYTDPARTSGGSCDECGRRGARHPRHDSSGIPGVVCDRCNSSADYELSFA